MRFFAAAFILESKGGVALVKTVLIADDEPIIRLDLRQILEEQGFEVVAEAADGFDAVEGCRAARPDAALIDLNMPVFDGMSAVETILQERLAGGVVILTAFADDAFVTRAVQAGAGGYLVKPVQPAQLRPALEVACAQGKRQRAQAAQIDTLSQKLADEQLIARAKRFLARKKGISEDAAYREIQKSAMDKRCPMAQIAQLLLRQDTGRADLAAAKALLMNRHGLNEAAAYRELCRLAQARGVTPEEAAALLRRKEMDG